MKKVLLSAVALLAFGFANAQEEKSTNGGFSKGDVFVSGAVSFGSTKSGDFKQSNFTVAPKVGYFVTENIAVGASVGFQSLKFNIMAVLKVIEVLSSSSVSWEDATRKAVSKASNTLKNIRSVYVQDQSAAVVEDEVTEFRVNLKITFELD